MILLTIYVSLAIAETPFTTALAVALEIIGEALGFGELVLRSRVEMVRGWVWEIGVDPRGTLVVNGWCSIRGFAAEPGDIVGLLHDCSRRCR